MDSNVIHEEDELNTNSELNYVEQAKTLLLDLESTIQPEEMESDPIPIRSKRNRESDEEEQWIEVGRNGKRTTQKVDIYVNSAEPLPKQFAFAKLLKSNNIEHVSRVKYINPYKVLLQFDNSESAEELKNCKSLQDLGWRCQKPMEVVISYGVIKDVELELNENDMLKIISSEHELIAVKRLKRKNKDGNVWEECESVRLAFKGSSLPAWVHIYGMKINVDPYVFPVTQCSRCWRFGHSLRLCPTKKVVCPKCGKNHANCETTIFKCVNCTGAHMSLNKSCPAFTKEKRLRDLMAEFNCSYRRALQIYVPPEPPTWTEEPSLPIPLPASTTELPKSTSTPLLSQNINHTYASITRKVPVPNRDSTDNTYAQTPSFSQPAQSYHIDQPAQEKSKKKKKKNKKKRQNESEVYNWDMSSESEAVINDIIDESENETQKRKERRENNKSTLNLSQLLSKLYTLIYNSQDDIKSKIIQGVSLSIEWLVSIVGQYIWDLPFKSMFGQ